MTRTRWSIVPESSGVEIEGSSSLHPIRASAGGLRGWLEASVDADGLRAGSEVDGHVEIEVARLSSGNPLVDRETRRRIDALRHPLIIGDVTAARVVDHTRIALDGVIGFRGESVEVEGEISVAPNGDDGITIEGGARLDVRWWGLRPPRFGLLRVYPEIDVRIRFELVRDERDASDEA